MLNFCVQANYLSYNVNSVLKYKRVQPRNLARSREMIIIFYGLISDKELNFSNVAGKVNMTKENMRLKWGVGRMIFEAPVTPIVIPIWHIGMDDVLPNYPPYVLKFRKNLTFNYGQPIDFTEMIKSLKERKATDVEARKEITDRIQEELLKLKEETELLHQKYFKFNS